MTARRFLEDNSMVRFTVGRSVAVGAVLLLSAACGGDDDAKDGAAGSTTSAGASQSAAADDGAKAPTAAELKAALLTAKELPSGYTAKASESGGENEGEGGDAGCLEMQKIDEGLFGDSRPGQAAHAGAEFNNADESGGGDQVIAGFDTEDGAKKEFAGYTKAADACKTLTLELDATNKVQLRGTERDLPKVGDESKAYRYQGTIQGQPFWMDAVAFRVGNTLSLVTAGGVGRVDDQLLAGIAGKAASKLAA